MKELYIAPDIQLYSFKISEDILGDSKWEDKDKPIGGGSDTPIDDDFV